MSGLLHHFALSAKTRTGLSFGAIVWALVASISIVAAIGLFLFAAFVAITQRYDAVTAGLALGGFFFVIATAAIIACLTTRRHNIERARLELASRSSADLFDSSLLALGLQIGRTIGWQRLASVAAAGVLAAGLAREWRSGDQAQSKSDTQN
jgi:hypothetical protein